MCREGSPGGSDMWLFREPQKKEKRMRKTHLDSLWPISCPSGFYIVFKKDFPFLSVLFLGSVLAVVVGLLPSDRSGNVRKRCQNVPGRVPRRLGYVALQGTSEKGKKDA